jgi:hypothetical protein
MTALLANPGAALDSADVRRLIAGREQVMKGQLARLHNPNALERWTQYGLFLVSGCSPPPKCSLAERRRTVKSSSETRSRLKSRVACMLWSTPWTQGARDGIRPPHPPATSARHRVGV